MSRETPDHQDPQPSLVVWALLFKESQVTRVSTDYPVPLVTTDL